MAEQPRVMISSTARDLPEHRKEAMDACLRQGMFPIMMEHLPASDDEAIPASLRMGDEADIYLLILAHRYGYVPDANNPARISVTEHEYNRAVERKIPILTFAMHEDHPVKAADVEKGEGAVKLDAFKARALLKVTNFFTSPADLRAHVINSLSQHREADLTKFHYVSDIPAPPDAFIAHPYTLLQTHRLVGRQPELNLLTDWVAKPNADIYRARILNIVAVGGLGKSALTWKWFNDIAPQEMRPLAGRMWWSFYESDATFENFVTRALAYISHRPLDEVQQIPAPERETQLLAALDREPFLLVLDGLERILIAYARMDASRFPDDDLDGRTANSVAGAFGTAGSAARPFADKHQLRKFTEPRAANFVRKLSCVKNSRILISTRLYPADLQTVAGAPAPSCSAYFLRGLNDDDALGLWKSFGVGGRRDDLLRLFHAFENHPLLIQTLAGEIANYRPAPGDFDLWRRNNAGFDPSRLPMTQVKSHVLSFALSGLGPDLWRVIEIIAALRMPVPYYRLSALLVGQNGVFPDGKAFDVALTELEDRGLLGWDRAANRYDLHPVIRNVVWGAMSEEAKRETHLALESYFRLPSYAQTIGLNEGWEPIGGIEDLDASVEYFNALVGLGLYDEAYEVYRTRITNFAYHQINTNRQLTELLEMLFPDGPEQLPRLSAPRSQADALFYLAEAYSRSGQLGKALGLFRRAAEVIRSQLLQSVGNRKPYQIRKAVYFFNRSARDARITLEDDVRKLIELLDSLPNRPARDFRITLKKDALKLMELLDSLLRATVEPLRWYGALRESESTAREALLGVRLSNSLAEKEDDTLVQLAEVLLTRGLVAEGECAMRRTLRLTKRSSYEYTRRYYAALAAYRLRRYRSALKCASRAAEYSEKNRFDLGLIRAMKLRGKAALALSHFADAEEFMHQALGRARAVDLVDEEIQSLNALAELRRRQGDAKAARQLLDDVWEAAERGPYPLIHADAFNVLAQIERDEGNTLAAIEAATKAYRLAWCDGPPFAYHWGLEKAKQHLKELGAPEPEMPPFDESKFEPMPEVEINPKDEFYVDEESVG